VLGEKFHAWVYSLSFWTGAAALLYLRGCFGYDWPLPSWFGLFLLGLALSFVLRDSLLPQWTHKGSQVLRKQSFYSAIWLSVVGIWLYWKLFGDAGLVVVITAGSCLWALSHRELLRLYGR